MANTQERGRTPRELLLIAERKTRESCARAEHGLQLLSEAERLNLEAKALLVLSAIRERRAA